MATGIVIALLLGLVVYLLAVPVIGLPVWLGLVLAIVALVIAMSTAGYEIGKKR